MTDNERTWRGQSVITTNQTWIILFVIAHIVADVFWI